MMKNRKFLRSILSLILILTLCLGMIPLSAGAVSQETTYHDPAENWLDTAGRSSAFNNNAIVTQGTIYCRYCTKEQYGNAWEEPRVFTPSQTFRVPEYTKTGVSDASRNIRYSDGTLTGGTGQGNVMYQSPNAGGIYTGYHWTKTMCMKCGRINTNNDTTDYCYLKDVYTLFDCASDFDQQTLPEHTEWEYLDDTHHYKTVTTGAYCGFCFGTHKSSAARTESHTMERSIRSELSHDRFILTDRCSGCGFSKTSYVLAKAVVANYEGVADGQPHTITVSDLSEAGVTTQIRYGTSAESCTLSSAPNYMEAGSYPVYYQITYTCQNTDMVEDGVAYVRLTEQPEDNGNGSCEDGNHNYALLEKVAPTCNSLGYSRYLCADCGKIEKRDYLDSLGHNWQSISIRESDCTVGGKVLNLCSRCGLAEVKTTPKGEHEYRTHSVEATCTNPGYTLKECSICGDRHISNLTNSLPHDYRIHLNPATCENGGNTLHRCDGCGSSFVTDYTDPLGHTWDGGRKVTLPTCSGEGVTEYHCIRCDCQQLRAISAEGHTPEEKTCTKPQVCTKCSAILALPEGHKPGEWIIDEEPTADSEGKRHKECENCGEVLETETMEKLDQTYHGAYIVGYPDGSFGPGNNMTRAEAAAIFARILAEKNGDRLSRFAVSEFSDVSNNAWYSGAVKYLSNYEVVCGRERKRFAPNASITRAEFTAMAVRFFSVYEGKGFEKKQEYKGFSDVSSGYWAAKYIREAAACGWITGYRDGTFRGENNITRAEAVTIVNHLLEREADHAYISDHFRSLTIFPDVAERHWAYWDVLEAANPHGAVSVDSSEAWKEN